MIKSIINFLLYSNIWIATAAVTMTWQTQLLLSGHFEFSDFPIFVFAATLLLYAVHRLMNAQKWQGFPSQERFFIVQRFKNLLTGIAWLSFLCVAYLFFRLTDNLKIALLLPILLAAGYALPVLPGKKRLRDLPFLKNLLIAGVWTWITVALPAMEKEMWHGLSLGLLLLGRFCFIFALSLPFDIRDMNLDQTAQVRTIPVTIGVRATKILAIALNMVALSCAVGNYWLDFYTTGDWLATNISVLCSSGLIVYAHSGRQDWYYAGWLDSMMILQFLLVWIF